MTHLLLVLVTAMALSCAAQGAAQTPAKDLAALKVAAEQGGAQAQLDYAKALGSGEDGRAWAQKAADQGLAEAWFWLGYTAPGDESLRYYERAADMGYPEAFDYALDGLLFRAGADADVVKAKKIGDRARALGIDLGWGADRTLATIDRCFEAGRPEIPVADRPTEEELAALGTEDCVGFQEGSGGPKDLVKYRKCLLAEDPVDNNGLAEIYANGWGVTRNPRLALALVCHGSQVPAELVGMVETLYDTRNQKELDEAFLFCAHVTSGMNQGRCAARDEGLAEVARKAALTALLATWTEPQQTAFRALQDAADGFFTTHSSSELDMSGTARAAIALEEEGRLRDEFLNTVREFEAGGLPDAADFKKADIELNAVYGRIMKQPELDLGTVDQDGIRKTQRAWLAYRDAWAAFGRIRYPRVSDATWKAWATTARVAQLKELTP